MRSMLTQLENNEAVLLMYVANELPAEDRAEVEEMLSWDDTLRAQLEQVRQQFATIHAGMGKADAASPLPSAFSAARAFGDQVRRRIRPPSQKSIDEKEDASRRRLRLAMYPLIAAAAVALGMALWWKSAKDEINRPPMAANPEIRDSTNWYASDSSELRLSQVLAMWEPQVSPDLADAQMQVSLLNYLDESDVLQ